MINELTQEDFDFINSHTNKPNWTLCFDSTINGNSPSTFHNQCDGKGATVVTVQYNNKKFAGYSEMDWNEYSFSGSGYKDTTAYLFGLDNNTVHSPTNAKAIHSNYSYGPTFGNGHDLLLLHGGINNQGYCYDYSYSNWTRDICGVTSSEYRFTSFPIVKVYAVQ